MSDQHPDRGFGGYRRRDGTPLPGQRAERSLRFAYEVIGRKWSLPIIFYLLRDGPLRFNELAARIDGLSTKVLADNLKHLERNGIVDRTVIEERVEVSYSLTGKGQRLRTLVAEAIEWGAEADTTQHESATDH